MEKPLWQRNFETFKEYVHKKGCFPTLKTVYKDVQVGKWIASQRRKYKDGLLKPAKVNLLNEFNPCWLHSDIKSFEYLVDYINTSNEFWKENTPVGKTPLQNALSTEMLFECITHGIYDCETYIEKYHLKAKAYDINLYRCYAKILNIGANYLILLSKFKGVKFCSDVISWYNSQGFSSGEELEQEIQRYMEPLKPKEVQILLLRSGFDVEQPLTLQEIGDIYDTSRATIHYEEKVALEKMRSYAQVFGKVA